MDPHLKPKELVLKLRGSAPIISNKRSDFISTFRPSNEENVIRPKTEPPKRVQTSLENRKMTIDRKYDPVPKSALHLPVATSTFDFESGSKLQGRPKTTPVDLKPKTPVIEEQNEFIVKKSSKKNYKVKMMIGFASKGFSFELKSDGPLTNEIEASYNDMIKQMQRDIQLMHIQHQRQAEERRSIIRGKYQLRFEEYKKKQREDQERLKIRKEKHEQQKQEELVELNQRKDEALERKKKMAEMNQGADELKQLIKIVDEKYKHRK